MATLYIEEYAAVGAAYASNGPWRSAMGAAQEPSNNSQVVVIGASSTQCATKFMASTQYVRLHCDAICSVQFGLNPTATTSNKRLTANQTEYFGVRPGDLVAVIQNV